MGISDYMRHNQSDYTDYHYYTELPDGS